MLRADSLEKNLMLGKIENRRRRGRQRIRWLGGITDSMDMNLGKFWEMMRDREARSAAIQGPQRVGCDLATEQQQSLSEPMYFWFPHKKCVEHPPCAKHLMAPKT